MRERAGVKVKRPESAWCVAGVASVSRYQERGIFGEAWGNGNR